MKILVAVKLRGAEPVQMTEHGGVNLFLGEELAEAVFQVRRKGAGEEIAEHIVGEVFFKEHGLFVEIQRMNLVVTEFLGGSKSGESGRKGKWCQFLRHEGPGEIDGVRNRPSFFDRMDRIGRMKNNA